MRGFHTASMQRAPFIEVLHPPSSKGPFDEFQILDPLIETRLRYALADIGNRPQRILRFERIVLISQVTTAGGPDVRQQGNMSRDFEVVLRLMAQDRAERRMHQRGIGAVAILHVIRRPFVIPLFAHDRTNQRDRFHLLRHQRQAVADLDSLHRRGNAQAAASDFGLGMRIKGFELARAPLHPEDDERVRRLAARFAFGCPRELLRERRQERHPRQTHRLQHTAPREVSRRVTESW